MRRPWTAIAALAVGGALGLSACYFQNPAEITAGQQFTITFDLNDEGDASPLLEPRVVKAGTVTGLPNVTREGYTFDGWWTDTYSTDKMSDAFAGMNGAKYTPTGDITLYAHWTEGENGPWTVTFYKEDGTGAAEEREAFLNGPPPEIDKPSRTGYTFDGYFTGKNGGGTRCYDDEAQPTMDRWEYAADIDLYASWLKSSGPEQTYTVTLDKNAEDATDGATTSVQATFGAPLPPLTAADLPSRPDYTFQGFYSDKGGTGTRYYTAAGGSGAAWEREADGVIYARWLREGSLPERYTITYNGNGHTEGSAPESQTKIRGTALTLRGNTGYLVKTAVDGKEYAFTGWNTQADGLGVSYGADYYLNSDPWGETDPVTLYAAWTEGINVGETYTIHYDANGDSARGVSGSPPADQTKTIGTPLTLQTNSGSLAREGYAFDGWNTQADGAGADYTEGANLTGDLSTTPGSAATLYARWKPNTYTVKYDGNGADSGATASSAHTYDVEAVLTPNGFTRTAHTFSGKWNTRADGSGTEYDGNTPVKNLTAVNGGEVTLYAQWVVGPGSFNLGTNTGTGGGWIYRGGSAYTSELRVISGADLTVTGSTRSTHIVVEPGAVAAVTLDSASIDFVCDDDPGQSVWSVPPLRLEAGANLTLALKGSNRLEGIGHAAGLNAPKGTTLTITSASGFGKTDGSLYASNGSSNHGSGGEGAAIGGNDGEEGGNITINGGHLYVESWGTGAGIGGGAGGSGGTLTFAGGISTGRSWGTGQIKYDKKQDTFYAGGEYSGAGIGGGRGGSGGVITITGGTVQGVSEGIYYAGAGIGGGSGGEGGVITITGGAVDARVGECGTTDTSNLREVGENDSSRRTIRYYTPGSAALGGGYGGGGGAITITGGSGRAYGRPGDNGASQARGVGPGADGWGGLFNGGSFPSNNPYIW